ncbi:MAG: hypothetical protein E6Z15_08470 [Paenibacillus macerans]|uniref:hypothetical protein n=1 Tax=Paenibacillus macerans TaxID=44252 RepID=UPI00242C9802|nr:hypothetical protein [Paenibacillus macerans]MDU5947095.1 hypothetical protein [Paenibacillus macerans]
MYLSNFAISEVLKNETDSALNNSDTMIVQENAATGKDMIYSTMGYQLMNNDEEYLLFLRPSKTEPGVNVIQGVYFGKVPTAKVNGLVDSIPDVQFQGSEETQEKLQIIFEEARAAYLK